MFLGEFEHSIDDKGRLTIPARFRDELESGVVVTRGLDGCLWAFPRSEWEKLVDKLSQMPNSNQAARNFSRFFFSNAFDSIPDRQGRVLLPQKLRDYAGITSEATVIGVNSRVELWNPQQWSKATSQLEENPETIVAQLEEFGINF